jgi:NTP pyrophosphatase (non-canonical NTP hydrolase)
MQIAEFQRWTQDADRETQWDLITTPQLISHLTEEIGEVAQSVNRIYGYAEEKKQHKHRANLGLELVEAFWFLAKIANRFDIDLDAEASNFIENADEWQGKYLDDLMSSLQALAACRREDFSPNTIGGKIAAIEHI